MLVTFIDTSVMTNLLDIPHKNEHRQDALEELHRLITQKGNVLILPITTIIETGNHISHIADGHIRRQKAELFCKYLRNTALENAPWQLYGNQLDNKDLLFLADHFQNFAMQGMGLGDLSIIRQYQTYKDKVPASQVRIWTYDKHLASYNDTIKH